MNLKKLFHSIAAGPAATAVLVCLALSSRAAEKETLPPLRMDEVTQAALNANPSIKALQSSYEAMKARVPQEKAWEDPRFGLKVERMGTASPEKYTDFEWSLSQTIPLSKRNRARAEAAGYEAEMSALEIRKLELEITAKARTSYYQLANAYQQLLISDEAIALLRQIAEISRSKFGAGMRSQADVFMAETELGKLEEGRFDILNEVSMIETKLNVLMNKPPQAPLGKPIAQEFNDVVFDLGFMQNMAMEHRPDVMIAKRRIETAQARLKAARRSTIPDPEVFVMARQFNDSGRVISELDTGLSFPLPWVNRKKYRAQVDETTQWVEVARHQLEATTTETLGMVRDHLTRTDTLRHHVHLFEGRVIPLARATINALRLNYETDKASLLEVLQARRELQMAQSMYWNHLTDYLVSLAELHALVGATPKPSPLPPKP